MALTLVDTGYPWSGEGVLAGARALGGRIRRIVVTHAHPDHAGSAALLHEATGAPVLAHRQEVPFLVGERSLADVPGSSLCRAVLWVGHRLGILEPAPVPGVVALEEGDRVGGLEVLATPGTHPGRAEPLGGAGGPALLRGQPLQHLQRAARGGALVHAGSR